MLKQGIIILATGNPYYGRMAWNLALSIKAVDSDFPVAIVKDGKSLSHLSEKQVEIFDHIIEADGIAGFGAKLHMDLLSPFEKTLYLDADMAWLPKYSPRDLIRTLKEVDFASITEGYSDPAGDDANPKYYYWAEAVEIRQVYNLPIERIYQWRSEVMYFTRSERVTGMFSKAREIYANPGLKTIAMFGNHIPDELAINIATALTNIEPHVYKWKPAYWPRLHGEHLPPFEALYSAYYALSCGSNVSSMSTKKMYDRIIKAAAYKLKTKHVFPLLSKREFMPERQKI